MSYIRWKPSCDVTAWHQANENDTDNATVHLEFDKIFDPLLRGGAFKDSKNSSWLPAVDIVENETEYLVQVELPGVDKNDVKINVANSVLTVKGDKKSFKEGDTQNFHRTERMYGSFQRSFTLPTTVKADKIEAVFNNGVLGITLPKIEEVKPKDIEVKVK